MKRTIGARTIVSGRPKRSGPAWRGETLGEPRQRAQAALLAFSVSVLLLSALGSAPRGEAEVAVRGEPTRTRPAHSQATSVPAPERRTHAVTAPPQGASAVSPAAKEKPAASPPPYPWRVPEVVHEALRRARGESVTVAFTEAPLREVLEFMGREARLTVRLACPEAAEALTTLSATAPPAELLNLVSAANRLRWSVADDGAVVVVRPDDREAVSGELLLEEEFARLAQGRSLGRHPRSAGEEARPTGRVRIDEERMEGWRLHASLQGGLEGISLRLPETLWSGRPLTVPPGVWRAMDILRYVARENGLACAVIDGRAYLFEPG